MNEKIAALAQYAVQTQDIECNEFIEVDISGGGIRFETDKSLPVAQEIKMEIMLLPQYYGLTVLGKVVNCEIDHAKNTYKLAVVFVKIQESDRDVIVGHVLKMQSKQLRAVKENENQSSKDDNISLNQ